MALTPGRTCRFQTLSMADLVASDPKYLAISALHINKDFFFEERCSKSQNVRKCVKCFEVFGETRRTPFEKPAPFVSAPMGSVFGSMPLAIESLINLASLLRGRNRFSRADAVQSLPNLAAMSDRYQRRPTTSRKTERNGALCK